jgi:hypothetical protein
VTTTKRTRERASDLEQMPTLAIGQTDDLKIDRNGLRVWLARTGPEDGEMYRRRITVERLIAGRWEEVDEYEGDRP